MQLIHVMACYDFPSLPLAIKNIFIEGTEQTLISSWDCKPTAEVINISANMTLLSDESQKGIFLAHLLTLILLISPFIIVYTAIIWLRVNQFTHWPQNSHIGQLIYVFMTHVDVCCKAATSSGPRRCNSQDFFGKGAVCSFGSQWQATYSVVRMQNHMCR